MQGKFAAYADRGRMDPDAAYDEERQRVLEEENPRLVDETMPEYLADKNGPSLSSGIAHLIVTKSSLHAWHAHPKLNLNYRETESDTFDYGTAAHALLLDQDGSKIEVVDFQDWRKDAAKEARANARAAGKVPMLKRQMDKVTAMVAVAVNAIQDSEIAEQWNAGKSEQSLYWNDCGGKVKCRIRMDRFTRALKPWIFDYKSCMNAEPESFTRAALGMGYDMQEAFYRRGVKVLTKTEPNFVFLAQEKEEPFACSLVSFDPAMQEMADRKVAYAMALWQGCIESGKWRGYPNRIAYMMPPAWYQARAEEWGTDDELADRMNP